MKSRKLAAGLYEVEVSGVVFSIYHQRDETPGYQWVAENTTQVIPSIFGRTKRAVLTEIAAAIARTTTRR